MVPVNATDVISSADVQASHEQESRKGSIRYFWRLWLLSIFAIALVLFITLPIAPFLHMDEFTIVDLGRVILNPETDWSIAWLVDQQQPVFLLSYVGPVVQELSYEFGGQFGPRVTSVIGGITAATVLVFWLLSRKTFPRAAFLLGIIFLLDPLFLQAFTLGRLDGWAMALCFGSCLTLRRSTNYPFVSGSYKARIILAGTLAGIAFFVWPSAALLYPLIIMELLYLLRNSKANYHGFTYGGKIFLLFIAGGGAATLLLILPIATQLLAQLNNIIDSYITNTHAPNYGGDIQFNRIRSFISTLKFTPVLVIFSIIAIVKTKRLGITLALISAVLLMLVTIVYIHRVVYLVPFMIICVSLLFVNREIRGVSFRMLKFLGPLLIWVVVLSLGLRTYMAFDANATSDRELVHQAAVSMVGEGERNVLMLSAAELYYSGRSLGWKMYVPYQAMGQPLEPPVLQEILKRVDYVVMDVSDTVSTNHVFSKQGFYLHKVYPLYNYTAEKFTGVTTNVWRLRFLYSIYEQSYGPYALYLRKNQSIKHVSNSEVSIRRASEVDYYSK